MRRAEFAASCTILGVTHHECLDYHDGQLEFSDFWRTALQLVERMRRFKPDVVLTFGADGGPNTHTDHMLVSMLTQAAFHWAGRPKRNPGLGEAFQPRRLYTVTTNYFLPDRQPPLPSPWTVVLDIESARERKAEAFRAHTSQAPLMESTKALFEQYGHQEFYTLLATEAPQPARQMTDLFEGL
jgi:LmbE family N-acetylglucosaminyl deacetylase